MGCQGQPAGRMIKHFSSQSKHMTFNKILRAFLFFLVPGEFPAVTHRLAWFHAQAFIGLGPRSGSPVSARSCFPNVSRAQPQMSQQATRNFMLPSPQTPSAPEEGSVRHLKTVPHKHQSTNSFIRLSQETRHHMEGWFLCHLFLQERNYTFGTKHFPT